MEEKQIRAVYSKDTIRVYQAYSENIANQAVKLGIFGNRFKMDRMTWIKPSFLWMMYRCGWGTKDNQEKVLAIDIKRDAFDYLVENAVLSKYTNDSGMSLEEWKLQIQNSDIRCQWDPERDIYGNPLDYRSIQLGIRGKAVYSYVNEWIVKIEDITDYVKELDEKRKKRIDISTLLPQEKIYIVKEVQACERGKTHSS